MIRSLQYVILGVCLGVAIVMWSPESWITTLRDSDYRTLITIGIVLFLFILPAFTAVLLNEKVRPGERVSKATDRST